LAIGSQPLDVKLDGFTNERKRLLACFWFFVASAERDYMERVVAERRSAMDIASAAIAGE
jgi:hypothetical protein